MNRNSTETDPEHDPDPDRRTDIVAGRQATRHLAGHMAAETASDPASTGPDDGGLRWISPLGLSHSLDRLKTVPERYDLDTDDDLRVADLGAGAGRLTEALARWFRSLAFAGDAPSVEIVPNDLSPVATDVIADRTARFERVRDPVTGDVTSVMPPLAPFDLVYAVNVIQDTTDPVGTVRTISGLVRQGGLVVVTVPGDEATRLFPEYAGVEQFDGLGPERSSFDLPYMSMPHEIADQNLEWKQYAFPRERAVELFETSGFEVLDVEDLPADARGLPGIMEHIGADDDLAEMAHRQVERQAEDVTEGPSVDRYVLRRRESR